MNYLAVELNVSWMQQQHNCRFSCHALVKVDTKVENANKNVMKNRTQQSHEMSRNINCCAPVPRAIPRVSLKRKSSTLEESVRKHATVCS